MDGQETTKKPISIQKDRTDYRSMVLIVDDNPQYAKIFELLSDELKIDAHIVESCSAALEALQNSRFDLIIMDWLMPEVDGPACTGKIRKLAKNHKGIPIIGVTGYLQADETKCIEAGMDDYLAIPFTYEQLQEKLRQWLNEK